MRNAAALLTALGVMFSGVLPLACASADDPVDSSAGAGGTGGPSQAGAGGSVAQSGGAAGTGGSAAPAGSGGDISDSGGWPSAGGTGGSTAGAGGDAGTGGSSTGGSSTGGSSTGGSSTGGSAGASGSGGSAGGSSSNPCDDPNLVWKGANKTNYESYPDPGSEECIEYNGCAWAGQFAYCDDTMSEAWVEAHNIVSVFPSNGLQRHDLCLRKGSNTIVVTAIDTCGDSDCGGCCTENLGNADRLIDIEKYTNARWGVADGAIEWADLGENPAACD